MLSDRIPSRADIRLIRSLGQKKFREELGLFVVEGEKMVGEALTQKRFPVEAVYRLSDVGEEVMGRMSHLSSPSPALAVLRIPQEKIQDNAPPPALPSGLCLGLDSVRDPGNAGTILRLADWFGIGTVYLTPDCVDLYNPKTVQATMGSIFRQRAVTCDLHALVRGCTAAGIRPGHLPGIDPDGQRERRPCPRTHGRRHTQAAHPLICLQPRRSRRIPQRGHRHRRHLLRIPQETAPLKL